MITIPSALKEKYYEVCSEVFLGDNFFSRLCTLYYPPIREQCADCNTAWLGGTSKNVFQAGSPAPFNNVDCVYCGGNGYREKEVTDNIRLRIYWNKRDWIKTSSIVVANAEAQIIGSISDLQKIINAKEIKLVSEQGSLDTRFKLGGEPFYHGFGKDRYFVAFIIRC